MTNAYIVFVVPLPPLKWMKKVPDCKGSSYPMIDSVHMNYDSAIDRVAQIRKNSEFVTAFAQNFLCGNSHG